ncbi:rod shape-determining protein MreD [Aquihabitans sp. McL0605]|uniref:rod shape-determining protein MreD n=1 Tax=Aquihabitans sp. McL0605 TaxID=3415671 RepID=UPI003CF13F31
MSWPRTAAVVLGALVLQVCLFSRFSYEGARPDIMILLAIIAGYRLGPERGAIVGFSAGLAFDIVLTTPLGLSALVYTVVGYAVGVTTSGMVRTSRWGAPAVAAAGSAAGMVLYALVGALLGEPTLSGPSLATIVVLVAAVNAVLAPLAVRAMAWAKTDDRDRRPTRFAR